MKVAIFLFSIFISVKLCAQIDSIIDLKLSQIKNIPCYYYERIKPKPFPLFTDSAVNYILDQDKLAISTLIEKMADTSFTRIRKPHEESFFRKGDLALILLSYLNFIPVALISGLDLDVGSDCGYFVSGFFNYLDKNRIDFQTKYRTYYYKHRRK